MNLFVRTSAILWLGCVGVFLRFGAENATAVQVFADGQIVVEWVGPHATPPDAPAILTTAMRVALERVGPPETLSRLEIRVLPAPSWGQRLWNLFEPSPNAIQEGDTITLQTESDPLKLAFRIGHEASHWLTYRRNPTRPPLWLDEGLAQLIGSETAERTARAHKLTIERPLPDKLEKNLHPLEALVRIEAYPPGVHATAAYYWQSEALVRALHGRLGDKHFSTYMRQMCTPPAPAWQKPLREQWYFSDWDFEWLATQIRPKENDP